MVFNGIKTIYSIKLANAKTVGIPYKLLPNTTLNEKFNILVTNSNQALPEYPILNLLTIGVNENSGDTSSLTRLNLIRSKHRPTDAALFKHIPFYLRPIDEVGAYPPSKNVRLKTKISIQGKDYLAGYGYIINDIDYKDDILIYNSISDEYVSVTKLDTTTNDLLNLVPIDDLHMTLNDNTYITDFLKIHIYLTKTELLEIKNAMDILFGDTPLITELGLCNSIPTILDNGSGECYATQVAYFVDSNININDTIDEGKLEFYIDVGGMDIEI